MSKTTDDKSDLIFPTKLDAIAEGSNNSIALFSADLDGSSKKSDPQYSYNIYLPAPTGLGVNDQANYSTTDFGVFGAEKMMGKILKTALAKGTEARAAVVPGLTAEQGYKKVGFIVNPNTNTTFSGSGVRSFTFSYKFIPESRAETEVVKKIIRRFKALSYAGYDDEAEEPSTLLLSYPCKWKIKFLKKEQGGGYAENIFMPKLFECYLTGVQTNYNPNSNIFFNNAAPVEIDLNVSFQETRALTRADIDTLENELDQDGSFGKSTQTPKSFTPKKKRTSGLTTIGGVSKTITGTQLRSGRFR
jgi:hypothetical protein